MAKTFSVSWAMKFWTPVARSKSVTSQSPAFAIHDTFGGNGPGSGRVVSTTVMRTLSEARPQAWLQSQSPLPRSLRLLGTRSRQGPTRSVLRRRLPECLEVLSDNLVDCRARARAADSEATFGRRSEQKHAQAYAPGLWGAETADRDSEAERRSARSGSTFSGQRGVNEQDGGVDLGSSCQPRSTPLVANTTPPNHKSKKAPISQGLFVLLRGGATARGQLDLRCRLK